MSRLSNGNGSITIVIALVALVSFGWGLSFLALAVLLDKMAPMQVLAIRWTMTAALFLLLIAVKRIKFRLDLKNKSVIFVFLAGLSEPCAYSILEAYGIKLTSASLSAIFVASVPCMTLIIGILFFKHKSDAKLIVSILITFAGVVIAAILAPAFSMGGTRIGALCMTLAVVAASMYTLSSSKASSDFDPATVTAVMAFEGAILFDIICLAQGHGLRTFLIPFSDMKILGAFLFLAVICAFASYVCFNALLGYISAALASNIVGSLSTIIGVVAGIVFAGDSWGWYTVLGLMVTLVGVWLSSLRMKEEL